MSKTLNQYTKYTNKLDILTRQRNILLRRAYEEINSSEHIVPLLTEIDDKIAEITGSINKLTNVKST